MIYNYNMGIFKKSNKTFYSTLPSRDKKKIVTKSVRQANSEQLEVVEKYYKKCEATN